MDIWDLICGIYFVIIGFFFLVFNRFFAEKTEDYLNNKNILKHMGKGRVQINRGLGIVAGCLFLIFGVLLVYKYLS
jgi:hypothetical protein